MNFNNENVSEILWYKDNKVIRTDERFIIENKENRTTCTIKKATKDLEGTYTCKAVSDIGLAVTKAKLQVFQRGSKIKKGKETKEKVTKQKVIKSEEESVGVEDTLDFATVSEVQALDKQHSTDKVKKRKAKIVVSESEHIETEDIALQKKVDEKTKGIPVEEKAKPILTTHEHVVLSEQQEGESVEPFDESYQTQKGIIKMVEADSNLVAEVNELLEVINAKEFGPGETPLRELAKIGYLLRRGITIEQIESLYDSQYFPSLLIPQSQSALVQLVERQGHGALITEVLTEETAQDEDIIAAKVGFKAFLKMVEMKHSSVEEVIAQFYPEDFKPRSWEQRAANEVNKVLFVNIFKSFKLLY